jgi:hypothetical protein
MIPRFNARANDINLQIDLVRLALTPAEKVLQSNEEGLTEDERLTRLVESDLGGFSFAMHTKKSQLDV